MVCPKVSRQVSAGGPSRSDSSTFTARAGGTRGIDDAHRRANERPTIAIGHVARWVKGAGRIVRSGRVVRKKPEVKGQRWRNGLTSDHLISDLFMSRR